MGRIWVYKKAENDPSKQYYIPEEEFDENIYERYDSQKAKEEKDKTYNSKEAKEHREQLSKSRKGLDIVAFMAHGGIGMDDEFKERSKASIFNSKGKLDEGAVGNLLDIGLTGAQNRNKQREKKTGYGLRKMKTGKLIPKRK